MATVTDSGAVTASTLNQATYASASFAPASGDLLVVLVTASTTVDAGDITVSANGVTSMTRVDRSTSSTSSHSQYIFVANQLTTGTASMTVTFDCTGDDATGAIVMVARVAGMTKTGATAIKQSVKLDNGAGSTTPTFTFAASCLTGNPTLVVLGQVSTAGSVPPSGWTEAVDTSYSTPTIGGTYVFRDSGFTGTTITWGDTETAHGGVAVELDASASGVTGVATAAFGGTFTASGVPETFGTGAASLGFTATASGVPETFGVAVAAFGFTATADGVARALGVAAGSFGFTGAASGVVEGAVEGVAVALFGFTGSAAGVDRALGAAVASLGFAGTADGIDTALGVALAAFGFTGAASGTPETFGSGAGAFGFTATATGARQVLGVALISLGFTGTALGINFTIVTPAERTYMVGAETRVFAVLLESRTTTVSAESRVTTVPATTRTTEV